MNAASKACLLVMILYRRPTGETRKHAGGKLCILKASTPDLKRAQAYAYLSGAKQSTQPIYIWWTIYLLRWSLSSIRDAHPFTFTFMRKVIRRSHLRQQQRAVSGRRGMQQGSHGLGMQWDYRRVPDLSHQRPQIVAGSVS